MCMNCGCNEPNERHGNDANITLDDLQQAGRANGQDVDTTIGNIEKTYHESPDAQSAREGHSHEYATS